LEQAGDGFLMPGVFPVVDKPEAKSASKSNSQAKSKSEPHSASKSKSEPHSASKTASKHDSKV
jgi:hypothetical protein